MNERRPSRVFAPQNIAEEVLQAAPPVLPAIVEHLLEVFVHQPKREGTGLDGAIDTAMNVSQRLGQDQVIDYLHALSQRTITHGRPA